MINTNYLASVFTSHAVIKRMKQRRKGHLVFVSSIGGQVSRVGLLLYRVIINYCELRQFHDGQILHSSLFVESCLVQLRHF